jgi:hypothetical protein
VATDRTDEIDVERELRLLAAATRTADTDLSPTVLVRVAELPAPHTRSATAAAASRFTGWLRARWRAVTLVFIGVLIAGGAATPVGAAVARWFTFGGVEVIQGPPPPGSVTPEPVTPEPARSTPARPTLARPTVGDRTTPAAPAVPTTGVAALSLAAERVGFTPLVPADLPAPDRITVDEESRVVSMTWTDLGLRLDQFLGEPSPVFLKKMVSEIQFVDVGSDQGLWFDGPHELVYLDADGAERTETRRTAGNTLLWTHGPLTLRLEEAGSVERAVAIALTTR